VFAVLGLLVMLSAAGCVPRNVLWLPDSSGFVYSSTSGKSLVHYDLAKKSERVIVKDTGTVTLWPALSPDGKRIAVARCVNEEAGGEVKVNIYDLAGKLVQGSKVERWGKRVEKEQESYPVVTILAWAPDGKRIVVFYYTMKPDGADGGTFLYDVKGDTFVRQEGAMPIPFANPFRPDGNGILVFKVKGDQNSFIFLDLAGKEHQVAPPEQSEGDGWVKLLFDNKGVTSSWKGDVATLTRGSAVLSIDTAKLKSSFDPQGSKVPASQPKELLQEFALSGGMLLRILHFDEKDSADGYCRVEAFDPKTEKGRDLLKKIDPVCTLLVDNVASRPPGCMVFPSPDGKHAAIRYSPLESREDRIAVINAKGEVVSDAKAAK
jgi:hypothetical protein